MPAKADPVSRAGGTVLLTPLVPRGEHHLPPIHSKMDVTKVFASFCWWLRISRDVC